MGENILRGRRWFLGLSQERLAEIIGWRQEYISQVERGVKLVPKSKAMKMARALKLLPVQIPVAND